MKYTIDEFAREIRKAYPNDYDDLSNKKLVSKWLKKYPNDKLKVELKKNSIGIFRIILIVLAIFGGLAFLNDKVFKINSGNKANSAVRHFSKSSSEPSSYSSNVSNYQPPLNPLQSIKIKPEIAQKVDDCEIVSTFQFSDELKTKIKKILSDPNPDPESKDGVFCGDYYGRCKWCGKEIAQPALYTSAQTHINNFLFNPLLALGSIFSYGLTDDRKAEFRSEFEDICNEFEKGNKYSCELWEAKKEFCSMKCENEYNSTLTD